MTSPERRSRTLPDFKSAHTGVADADSASVCQVQTRLLAGFQNGRAAVAFDGGVTVEEGDLTAFAFPRVTADLGLEPLVVQPIRVAVVLPVLDQRIEQFAGTRTERFALAPVRTQLVQVAR